MTNYDDLREHFAGLDKQKIDAFTTASVQTLLAVSMLHTIIEDMDVDSDHEMALRGVTGYLNTAAMALEPLLQQAYSSWPQPKEDEDD